MSRVAGKIYRAVIRDGFSRPLYHYFSSRQYDPEKHKKKSVQQESWRLSGVKLRDSDLFLFIAEMKPRWYHVVFQDQHGWVELDGLVDPDEMELHE